MATRDAPRLPRRCGADVSRLSLTDGGVYDNIGLAALLEERCTDIIVSDTSGLFDSKQRASAGRLGMMGRIVSILMDDVAGLQRGMLRRYAKMTDEVKEARKNNPLFDQLKHLEKIHNLAVFHISSPPIGEGQIQGLDLNLDREFNFVINYIMGNSRSLNAMKRRYPENRIEWESFYAKSGLAVKYLYNKKRNGFYSLWERSGAERDFNKSFFRAFFLTQDQFSRMFEEYSRSHFTMEILLASTGLIWMIFPLILLIGGIRKKFRNKKIEQRWEEESIKFDEFETNGE